MKRFFVKISKQTTKQLREELARAHLIITLLSLIAIVLLILGVNLTVSLDLGLATCAGVLLSITAVISTMISYSLFTQK